MRSIRTVAGAAAAVAAWLVATPASADPATANSIQLGVGFRYGFAASDVEVVTPAGDQGKLNLWGIGLGLNGGYTLPNAVYVGGNLEYFFGDQVGDNTDGGSGNIWQITAEGGYDIGLGPIFVLRPKLGAGLANLHVKGCAGGQCTDSSDSKFALLPGATFILMPPGFRLSADLRYEFVLADQGPKAVILAVGIGF
ncbi:MAG TPA: outer membrane beta-barrel protein [Polyangiaceae bacterium]|nr:outer membrane beta-barrel protein [Polyangiaceae bacterium]